MANYHFDKLFTPEEAGRLIPRLEFLIRDLQSSVSEVRGQIAEVAAGDPEIGSLELPALIARYPQLRPSAMRMAELTSEIQALGCFLKDLDLGLVDFPWEIEEGRVVFLCWQPGEPEIAAWHPVETGFGDRRPLRGAPKQYLH
ncbi:MAG: DUF2203 domain-containing protein [Candidatus Binataceae bacterium]